MRNAFCILHTHSSSHPTREYSMHIPGISFLNGVIFSVWSFTARSLSLFYHCIIISAKTSLSSGLISAGNCDNRHQGLLLDALVAATNADSDLTFIQLDVAGMM